jgi:hypothetical protein
MFSINESVTPYIDELLGREEELGIRSYYLENQSTVIDLGVEARGSIGAGMLSTGIALGGLGKVTLVPGIIDGFYLQFAQVWVDNPAHQIEHAVDARLCPPDLLGRRQVDLGQRDDHRQLHGQQDAEVLPGDVGHTVVGGDDQQAVVQLLADDAPDGRPQPGLVAYRVDKRDDLVRLGDHVGALFLADNTSIIFTSNEGTSYVPGMGNLQCVSTNKTTVLTSGGYANVTFGQVNEDYVGDSAVIKAASGLNGNVNATVLITFYAPTGIPSHKPIQQISSPPQTTTPGLDVKGGITGRVTTFNTTVGLPNADVYIVNPNNVGQYYWRGLTNSQGFFQITDVNNTRNDAKYGYLPLYKAYCYNEMIGEGYSNNFSVEIGANAWTAILINPQATNIGLFYNSVTASSMDYTPLSVRLTDSMGNPVVDNARVTIRVDQSQWSASRNGSFGHGSTNDHLQSVTAGTVNGFVNASFGWVDSAYAGTSTRLNVSYGSYIGARCHFSVLPVPSSLVPTIGFALQEWTAVAGGTDATIAIRRYRNITVPASVTVSVSGGTATLNTDYTVSPALSCIVSFAAGEVEKTFTIHAKQGSDGKTIVLQLAGFTNATSDNAYTSTVRIERLVGEMIQQVGFPAQTLTPGVNKTGIINGRVTSFNLSIGIPNADVFLLNPYNTSQYYWHGHTDSMGYFNLANVNNTRSDAAGSYRSGYKMYCNDTLYDEGTSYNFTAESDSTAWAAIITNPVPAHIKINVERSQVKSDGSDRIKVWAYVTDAMNRPVG